MIFQDVLTLIVVTHTFHDLIEDPLVLNDLNINAHRLMYEQTLQLLILLR